MAEDDIDVEGEFDLKTELGEEFYDTNELPSKSANLLPEFTSPAWMLEQGWSLDSCMDEKSKATIEKMLLEEQQYMYGRKTSRYLSIKKNVLLVTAGTSKATTPNKSPWTQEEKNTFLRGMGIFGRSWSKIASLIPTRTSLQVKNYAQQYMKNLAKKKAEMEKLEMDTLKSMTETPLFNSTPSSLAATVASITTGQPTVVTPAADPQVKGQGRKQRIAPANKCDKLKAGTIHRPTQRKSSTKPGKEKNSPRKLKKLDLSGAAHGAAGVGDIVLQARTSRCNSVCSTSDGISTVNGSSDVSDVSNSSFTRTSKLSDEDDMDIDIDIENDDEENPILLSRSASPSSVYLQLLKAAHIGTGQLEQDGGTGQLSETKSDTSLDTSAKPNVTCQDFLSNPDNDSTSSQDGLKSGDDDSHLDAVLRTDDMDREEEEHHVQTDTIVNGLVAWSGEVLEFDVPVQEKVFPPNEITEEERRVHADFFDGRPPKTPERYLKIRSYIIDCWLKSKPVYLNKTCIRPGLKNCGDVNCIGRIHSYLECVGAINFGCEQANYRNPHRTAPGGTNSRLKGINKELMPPFPLIKAESVRPRKRRIRDESGLWVDEKELEGKTIDHNVDKKKCEAKAKVYRATKSVYDPFKLVPCTSFSADNPPPYKIEMLNTAVAIMDIHAHISKTEVIGMLGGQFSSNTLIINMAVPCQSMSTGMQCEMDPVSQTQASEQIEDVGMSVVGWYHSHPTFSPDPSVRDIETQQKFQYWFSKGGNQFVGVIISPYNPASPSLYSDIRCLTISESYSKEYLCNLPIKFDFEVIYGDNPGEILGPACGLADNYCVYNNRVKLSCLYKSALGITCLSKMLQSVKNILIGVEENVSPSGDLLISGQTTQTSDNGQITQSVDRSKENGQTIQQADRSKDQGQIIQSVDKNKEHGRTIQQADRKKVDDIILCLEQLFKEKFSDHVESSSLLSSLDKVQSNAT